ncbi:MAG TPA: neuraminidase-like domain-containing protein [Blastocatellia bacterium]|nr:neuraminidase-like domain-containing protein [Blastocatellia bacterium]
MKLQGRNLHYDKNTPLRGGDVRLLHTELRMLGFPIPLDELEQGIFGPGTDEAIRTFQQRANWQPINGVVEEKFATHINASVDLLPQMKISGTVLNAQGVALPNVIVYAYDRDLRSATLIHLAVTDNEGKYGINYSTYSLMRGDVPAADPHDFINADLLLKFSRNGQSLPNYVIKDENGKPLPTVQLTGEPHPLPVLFNAPNQVQLDVVINESVAIPETEFDRYVKQISLTLVNTKARIVDLREDDQFKDVSFIAAETRIEQGRINLLIQAYKLEESVLKTQAKVEAEIFYGLLRQQTSGQSIELKAVVAATLDDLRARLQKSLHENIISLRTLLAPEATEMQRLGAAIERLKQLKVQQILTEPVVQTKTTLKSKLDLALPQALHNDFATAWVEHRGLPGLFWKKLKEDKSFESLKPHIDDLLFTFELAEFTQEHQPLVTFLYQEKQQNPLAQISDLAKRDVSDWHQVITDNKIGTPNDFSRKENEKPEERIGRYAQTLRDLASVAFPTVAFTHLIKNSQTRLNKQHFAAFFANNKNFDITAKPIQIYLKEKGNEKALDSIPEAERQSFVHQLSSLRRVYNFTLHPDHAMALIGNNIFSAKDVVEMGQIAFVNVMNPVLAAGQAHKIYEAASRRHDETQTWLMMFHQSQTGPHLPVLPNIQSIALEMTREQQIPNLETLFGSFDLCGCEHCNSIYSPAAYLVDILRFLEQKQANPEEANPDNRYENAWQVLFRNRRGDIGNIELTCENTNTPLPYIDLVNEILEDAVSKPQFSRSNDTLEGIIDGNFQVAIIRQMFAPNLSEGAKLEKIKDTATSKVWRISDEACDYIAFKQVVRDPSQENGTREDVGVYHSRQTRGTAQERAANPQYLNSGAYQKLKQAVYPLSLPFNLDIEEARTYLSHLGVQRHELMKAFQAATGTTTTLSDVEIATEYLGISTSDLMILTGNLGTIGQIWGVSDDRAQLSVPNPSDPGHFTQKPWREALGHVRVMLDRTGLTYIELTELLQMQYLGQRLRISPPEIISQEEAQRRGVAPIDYHTCDTTKLILHGLSESEEWRRFDLIEPHTGRPGAITPFEGIAASDLNILLFRIVRFIRLWRLLGWTMQELDTALMILNNLAGGTEFSDEMLVMLSHIQRMRKEHDLSLPILLSWYADIDTTKRKDQNGDLIKSHYEQVFLNPTIVRPHSQEEMPFLHLLRQKRGEQIDPAFILPAIKLKPAESESKEKSLRTALQGAFRLKEEQLDSLLNHLIQSPAESLDLTLRNLSKLYRIATLTHTLGLSIDEHFQLLELTGIGDPFEAENAVKTATTLRFIEAAHAVQNSGFSIPELLYLLKHKSIPNNNDAISDETIANVLTEIRQVSRKAVNELFVNGELTSKAFPLLGGEEKFFKDIVDTFRGEKGYEEVFSSDESELLNELLRVISYPLFIGSDFTDLRGLATKLAATDRNQLSAYLLDQLSDETRRLLGPFVATGDNPNSFLAAFIRDLNVILGSQSLYSLERFEGISLSAQAIVLLRQTPPVTGTNLYRLNRLLLADAYPSEIRQFDTDPLPDELREKFSANNNKLSFRGPMNDSEKDLLDAKIEVAGATDAVALKGVIANLYEQPRKFVSALEPKFTVSLDKLPEGYDLPEKVTRNDKTKQIILRGWFRDEYLPIPGIEESDSVGQKHTKEAFKAAVGKLKAQSERYRELLQLPADNPRLFTEDEAKSFFNGSTASPQVRFEKLLWKLVPRVVEEIVGEVLSKSLQLDPTIVDELLHRRVHLAADRSSKAIFDFTEQMFISGDLNIESSSAFPTQSRILLGLYNVAKIIRTLRITQKELVLLLQNNEDGDGSGKHWLDVTTLFYDFPVEVAQHITSLTMFLRFVSLVRLLQTRSFAEKPGDTSGLPTISEFIAELMRGVPTTTKQKQLEIQSRLGVSAAQCAAWAKPDLHSEDARAIKQTVKAKYDDQQWNVVSKPLRDVLREKQRAALVAYLLVNPPEGQHWRDANDLYSYFLIDVEMSSCFMTSRIKQAVSSVQLFVQRCLMNLEQPYVTADSTKDENWLQWKWMKNYRVWEANRKVFCYPENWIEPELRDDKTPFFKELENELMQNDITNETAEDAIRHYLEKLEKVARLDIRSVCHEERETLENPRKKEAIMHIIGRTYNDPKEYYCRRWVRKNPDSPDESSYFTPWEKVDLDIEGDHLISTVANNRVYLFWPIFTEKNKPQPMTMPKPEESMPEPDKYFEIQMAWSEYKGKKWEPKRLSEGNIQVDWKIGKGRNTPTVIVFPTSPFDRPAVIQGSTADPQPISFEKGNDKSRYLFAIGLEADLELAISSYSNYFAEYGTGEKVYSNIFEGQFRLEGGRKLLAEKSDHRPIINDAPLESTTYKNNLITEDSGENPLLLGSGTNELTELTNTPGVFTIVTQIVDHEQFDQYRPFIYQDRNRAFLAEPLIHYLPRRYRFSSFYHPFAQLLTDSISLRGVRGTFLRDFQDNPNRLRVIAPVTEYDFLTQYYGSSNGDVFDGVVNRGNYPVLAWKYLGYDELREKIDYDSSTSYAQYNWELFFHIPLLIADRLSKNQRFEEAQKWFHFIFDPTDTSAEALPQKFWQMAHFFHQTDKRQIKDLIQEVARGGNGPEVSKIREQIEQWRDTPFNPHLIARLRTTAYQRNVVMKYINNLIAWGDQLFRRDTIESINEATQLYILAAEILGRRPEVVRPRYNPEVQTYNTAAAALRSANPDNLPDFNDPLVDPEVGIEAVLPPPSRFPEFTDSALDSIRQLRESLSPGRRFNLNLQNIPGLTLTIPRDRQPAIEVRPTVALPKLLYFCVPHNPNLMKYWDTVADRLFKIRHCQNIEGVVRQLPLFEPEIDPALLVRAAALGVDLHSVLNDIQAPLPNYRFSFMVQKALELCNEVKSLGAALLSAIEKKDVEQLSLLRSTLEINLLEAVREIKRNQAADAKAMVDSALFSKEMATMRNTYYGSKEFMNPLEAVKTGLMGTSLTLRSIAGVAHLLAGGLYLIPTIKIGAPTTTGMETGGNSAGNSAEQAGLNFEQIANILDATAGMVGLMAEYQRRKEEWDFQRDLAAVEMKQADKQIVSAQIRQAIADKEVINHDLQIKQTKEVDDYIRGEDGRKFSNVDLYGWMQGQVAATYFQAYQLAFDLAKRAERAYRHELGIEDSNYIQFGYWDSLKKGLLAGERLSLDLKRMEMAYLDQNRREYEITKHISILQLDPLALIDLKEKGKCTVTLPEAIFDLDYPGHYLRRIKSVSVTLPCVTGPYTGVSCTLTLLSSKLRTRPVTGETTSSVVGIQSIVTSSGQNDSGLFEPNLRDERYLPFEGAGAVESVWQLELPTELRPFDYNTLSDVILHMRYTARDGGESFRGTVAAGLKNAMNAIKRQSDETGLARIFSLRHEFPMEYASLKAGTEISFTLTPQHFPLFAAERRDSVRIEKIVAVAQGKFLAQSDSPTGSLTPDGNNLNLVIARPQQLTELQDLFVIVTYKLR